MRNSDGPPKTHLERISRNNSFLPPSVDLWICLADRSTALALTMTSAEKFFGSSQSKARFSLSLPTICDERTNANNVAGHMKSGPHGRRGIGSEGRPFPSCIAVYDFGSGFKVGVVRREERRIFGSPARRTHECDSSGVRRVQSYPSGQTLSWVG